MAVYAFLLAAVAFAGIFIARRGRLSKKWRIAQWASVAIATMSGGYIWLWHSALTIVTVTSQCPEYDRAVFAGPVSAGDRHHPAFRLRHTDYFAFVKPSEGEIALKGKARILSSYGYVTSIGINRIDFELDAACKIRANQECWA
jgi:hypothetical protein